MVPQAAIAIGIGVLGIGMFFGFAAYFAWQQQQQPRHRYRQEPLPPQPPAPKPVVFGPCGICGEDVLDESYLLPCHHHLHPTCAADITLSQGHPTFNWADICRNCVISRVNKDLSTSAQETLETTKTAKSEGLSYMHNSRLSPIAGSGELKNEGLRNRRTNRQICGHCQKDLLEDDETQELGCKQHRVHKTCGIVIATSGFTTCPMCMIEM